METLIVHPRSKSELILVKALLKKMDIRSKVIKEQASHIALKEGMLAQSKRFFLEKIDK
jgi:hypothetical protein